MIFNIFGGLVKSLGVYRHSPLLLAVFLIIQLICIIVSCIFDNMYLSLSFLKLLSQIRGITELNILCMIRLLICQTVCLFLWLMKN